ncbi:hypothetical protein DSL72_006536 [Monilinia vaccinii-corymbosi]|uniref:Uncharacterized protein n=1 Tax=Monilinia vaccinii-corymbosi TaxID=61207 RepID=A0A8A3PP11_9HELO|nr:hypothetical protein DSL72_006536 [Monilinia vaccinii-corymbosi]
MSSDSDSTPVPTFSPQTNGETAPVGPIPTEKIKPTQPDIYRPTLPDEHHESSISTPGSMKVESGSDGRTEPVSPLDGARSKSKGNVPEAEDNGSDASWEEVKHEATQGSAQQAQDTRPVWVGHGGENSAVEEVGLGEDIAPEFRPRTPRPYGSHSE